MGMGHGKHHRAYYLAESRGRLWRSLYHSPSEWLLRSVSSCKAVSPCVAAPSPPIFTCDEHQTERCQSGNSETYNSKVSPTWTSWTTTAIMKVSCLFSSQLCRRRTPLYRLRPTATSHRTCDVLTLTPERQLVKGIALLGFESGMDLRTSKNLMKNGPYAGSQGLFLVVGIIFQRVSR